MSKEVYHLKQYATEIVPNLWVGERFGCSYAQKLGFNTICVLENPCSNLGCIHRRILHPDTAVVFKDGYAGLSQQVDEAALLEAISVVETLYGETPLLVHCGAGVERSPLTVVVWMMDKYRMSIDEAYDILKGKRFQVEDRRQWLKPYR